MARANEPMKEHPSGDDSSLGRNEEWRRPRVVILPGTYHGWNMGDIAMLVVAITRLKTVWPKSEITVLAYEMEPFRRLCPGVELFSLQHRDAWLASGVRPSPVAATSGGTNDHEKNLRLNLLHATATEYGRTPINTEPLHTRPAGSGPRTDGKRFLDLMRTTDLFLMTGCGAINDVWNENAARILETSTSRSAWGFRQQWSGKGSGPFTIRLCSR